MTLRKSGNVKLQRNMACMVFASITIGLTAISFWKNQWINTLPISPVTCHFASAGQMNTFPVSHKAHDLVRLETPSSGALYAPQVTYYKS